MTCSIPWRCVQTCTTVQCVSVCRATCVRTYIRIANVCMCTLPTLSSATSQAFIPKYWALAVHQCALCVMRWSACAPPLSGGWGLILYIGLASQNRYWIKLQLSCEAGNDLKGGRRCTSGSSQQWKKRTCRQRQTVHPGTCLIRLLISSVLMKASD